MQLKALEIQGFKSFADKTQFLFDKGITGIVGPNGCGKSNIVDSIRWVLGEQRTRKLRSTKMENIIFNGTTKRRKAGLASVTLTFENTKNILPTEYTSVAITRKLYRNGDSEYLINGIPCRLKDIHNLFLDTGIGPDSYAIIELSMVDEILNDKENSRRILFEEAAGISKYKVRKKQTLRSLKVAELDLDRVEDVLFEIKKQLKALESQAKKAKRYFEIKEKYRFVSSQFAWFAIRNLRNDYDSIQGEEKRYEDLTGEIQASIARFEARIQELRKDQLDNENRLAESQKDLNLHIAAIQEIEKEKSIRNERLKYLQQREIAITDQVQTEKKSYLRIGDEMMSLGLKLEEVRQEHGVASQGLAELKQEQEEARGRFEELKFQVEGYAIEQKEVEQELNRLQKETDIKKIQVESFQQELERNEADKSSRHEEISAFGENLRGLEEEVTALDKVVTELRKNKNENDAALEASGDFILEVKDQIYKKSRGLDARMNEYSLTKSLVENLEGFPDSVKFLKKSANWVKDAPLLSDIFYIKEDYKVALENLLDPFLSYYVVESRVDAFQAVRLLADASKGRANFFILEELESYQSHALQEIPGTRPVVQIAEVGEKYQKLAEYLLDKVYLIDDDSLIPEDLPEGLVFITQRGNLMRKKYVLSGGSIGLFQGKRLGRAKNLEKLAREIKSHEKEINELKMSLHKQEIRHQKLKEQKFAQELEKQNNQLQTKKRDLSVLKAREKEYRDFLARVGKRTDEIEAQIRELGETIELNLPRINLLLQSNQEKTGILAESRMMLENNREEVSEKSSNFNQQNIKYIQLNNQLEMLLKDELQKQKRLGELEVSEKKNRRELQETKDSIHEIVQNSMQDDEEVMGLYEEKKVKEVRTGKLEQIALQVRSNIQAIEEQIRSERKKKEALEGEKGEVKDKVTEVKIKLNSLKERMEVEFKLDISDLDEEDLFDPKKEYDAEKIEEEMLKLRQRMQNYGEINPMAVEAFDEMKERSDFIEEQKKDLLEAKQTLLNTIAEIDKTASEKFMEAFVAIRTNFKQVFQHLFHEGDTCDLKLMDADDPLDSPIDIMAKPKGKRPLSINQLSGGEKTLTAISLLFAIYLLKPAPFCIFDEVDAPLDDANIDKFNNIIREFSKDSQFILVTHNKRTMAATNVMYGVTMKEQGISSILPVNMGHLDLADD